MEKGKVKVALRAVKHLILALLMGSSDRGIPPRNGPFTEPVSTLNEQKWPRSFSREALLLRRKGSRGQICFTYCVWPEAHLRHALMNRPEDEKMMFMDKSSMAATAAVLK